MAGKVALVTGAGSGIGAETAKLMAAEGAKVVVAALTLDSADAVVAQIKDKGGDAIAVAGDIAEEELVAAMVRRAMAAYGRIDVLHNNAAITDRAFMAKDADIVNMDVAVWDRTLAVNLRGPALFCKHVVPHMLEQKGGSIIFTGSGKGLQGDLEFTAYGASKAALINLMQNVATQYGKQGIRANILVVGLVLSDALRKAFPEQVRAMIESHHLTPAIGQPRDVANAALFLASDESAFVTGHELFVDGGVTAHAAFFADAMRARAAGH